MKRTFSIDQFVADRLLAATKAGLAKITARIEAGRLAEKDKLAQAVGKIVNQARSQPLAVSRLRGDVGLMDLIESRA